VLHAFDAATAEAVGNGQKTRLRLSALWRDERSSIRPGDWVEVLDEKCEPFGDTLYQVAAVQADENSTTVVLDGDVKYPARTRGHVRRWDQRGSGLADGVKVSTDERHHNALEDGIHVQFVGGSAQIAPEYRPGDHWLIPARTVTSGVDWQEAEESGNGYISISRPPFGGGMRFAPLAIIVQKPSGQVELKEDLRIHFER
jgi:hypothetical protein